MKIRMVKCVHILLPTYSLDSTVLLFYVTQLTIFYVTFTMLNSNSIYNVTDIQELDGIIKEEELKELEMGDDKLEVCIKLYEIVHSEI